MAQGAGSYTTSQEVEGILKKRLSYGIFILSVLVTLLYVLELFLPGIHGIIIAIPAVAFALLALIIAVVMRFWTPKNRHLTHSILYVSLAISTHVLILFSGGIASPLLGLWTISLVFATFFGRTSTIIALATVLIQIFMEMQNNVYAFSTILTSCILYGALPIAIGYILWRNNTEDNSKDPIQELSHHLSTAKGKSDIVINTIEDGVLTINGEGIIDLINPAAQHLIGWNQGDALGLEWSSVLKLVNIEGRDVPETEHPIIQSLKSNQQIHTDNFSILTGSDKKRMVSIVSTPIGGAGSGIVVVLRDITKAKAEEREQTEFISTASHEMRTPVASIEGYLGLALNPATAAIDEKARDYITKAHESAQHLGRLFQDLLDISKSDDGRLKNEPAIIDVTASVGNIFESLAPLAADKQLRYIFKPNPSLESDSTSRRLQPVYYAYIDPSHFREVLSNLIENAIKYTPSGDIIVDIKGDDRLITISITDSGIGIPVEDIPHLFQKFYRVDNSDTREIGGTGLGLYLCRKLAEAMGGTIRVTSQYKKGSTFFLDLPRTSHEDAMIKLNSMSEPEPKIALDDRPMLEQQPIATLGQNQIGSLQLEPEPAPATPEPEPITPVEPTPPAPTESIAPTPIIPPRAIPIQHHPSYQPHLTIEQLETQMRQQPASPSMPTPAANPAQSPPSQPSPQPHPTPQPQPLPQPPTSRPDTLVPPSRAGMPSRPPT